MIILIIDSSVNQIKNLFKYIQNKFILIHHLQYYPLCTIKHYLQLSWLSIILYFILICISLITNPKSLPNISSTLWLQLKYS